MCSVIHDICVMCASIPNFHVHLVRKKTVVLLRGVENSTCFSSSGTPAIYVGSGKTCINVCLRLKIGSDCVRVSSVCMVEEKQTREDN